MGSPALKTTLPHRLLGSLRKVITNDLKRDPAVSVLQRVFFAERSASDDRLQLRHQEGINARSDADGYR
jgi:hypothetical protein